VAEQASGDHPADRTNGLSIGRQRCAASDWGVERLRLGHTLADSEEMLSEIDETDRDLDPACADDTPRARREP
jgi:hypothetical protein